jgi:hypothetical protein
METAPFSRSTLVLECYALTFRLLPTGEQVPGADAGRIPEEDIFGVTVVFITGSYREQEFVRVGYYVNNYYDEEDYDPEHPPRTVDVAKLQRDILAAKPYTTQSPIECGWLSLE